ncbi:uncharacterized protein LACBIDRAFT_331836 [Laccaria bicolor S238N-H82]|uniref:Predicted protein n=1 Tax=Laccaria bicolor (strain S238N-H82 / ATCC MYA-4686) TaxID=486041 RepID=B0DQQ4_LACBS|nr:uncharacterized protein LACBIDRAFT_331836 [Laccaria bicolor S238N-H82]EDR03155.1 predicted protein [Laccaria bicolor S238N-H82]|eukprot:XP_001886296.1 predicted protein [Laccaria bicolor S238N-H82]
MVRVSQIPSPLEEYFLPTFQGHFARSRTHSKPNGTLLKSATQISIEWLMHYRLQEVWSSYAKVLAPRRANHTALSKPTSLPTRISFEWGHITQRAVRSTAIIIHAPHCSTLCACRVPITLLVAYRMQEVQSTSSTTMGSKSTTFFSEVLAPRRANHTALSKPTSFPTRTPFEWGNTTPRAVRSTANVIHAPLCSACRVPIMLLGLLHARGAEHVEHNYGKISCSTLTICIDFRKIGVRGQTCCDLAIMSSLFKISRRRQHDISTSAKRPLDVCIGIVPAQHCLDPCRCFPVAHSAAGARLNSLASPIHVDTTLRTSAKGLTVARVAIYPTPQAHASPPSTSPIYVDTMYGRPQNTLKTWSNCPLLFHVMSTLATSHDVDYSHRRPQNWGTMTIESHTSTYPHLVLAFP